MPDTDICLTLALLACLVACAFNPCGQALALHQTARQHVA